jgi:hypothetical protein
MDHVKKQRVCIKFFVSLGKSVPETLAMNQQAFGDQILSRTQVFQWHVRFKTGHTSADDDKHTGRPTSCPTPETVARIQELLRQDRRRTIHDITEEVGIGYGIYHTNGFRRKNWACTVSQLHHDNTPSHTSVFTQQFLVKYKTDVIPHLPYSPDLAPCDFFLFPKTKLKLKGRRFNL